MGYNTRLKPLKTERSVHNQLDTMRIKMEYMQAQLGLLSDTLEGIHKPSHEYGKDDTNSMILELSSNQILFNKWSLMFDGLCFEMDNVNDEIDIVQAYLYKTKDRRIKEDEL